MKNKGWQERTCALFGEEAVQKLNSSAVAVFGLGGVGGYIVEGLCRAGIGKLILADFDVITESNINRQILAHKGNINEEKSLAAFKRVKMINPDCEVIHKNLFVGEENISGILRQCRHELDKITGS